MNMFTVQYSGPLWGKVLLRVLWSLVIALLVLYALFFLRFALSLIAYPFDWDPDEGGVIVAAKMLAAGQSWYRDPGQFPMLPYIYPPVVPGLVFVVTRLFGETLGAARAVSLFSAAGTAVLIYRIVRRYSPLRTIALVSSLLLFAFPVGAMWFATTRPDAFFCLLLVAGFSSLSWAASTEGGPIRIAAPLALFLLASLTKHVGLSAAVAAGILLTAMDHRRGFIFLGAFAAFFLAALTFFEMWSGGWFIKDVYAFATRLIAATPLTASRLSYFFSGFLALFLIPILVALPVVSSLLRRRVDWVWPGFFVLTLLWATQTGRNGFAHNHFLPAAAAASILFGISLEKWRCWWSSRYPGSVLIAGCCCAVLVLGALVLPREQTKYLQPPMEADRKAWAEVVDAVRAAPGPVMIDMASSAAILSGRGDYATESTNLMFAGADAQVARALIPLITQRRFEAIVIFGNNGFHDDVKLAIMKYYSPVMKNPVHTLEVDAEQRLMYWIPRVGTRAGGPDALSPGARMRRPEAPKGERS